MTTENGLILPDEDIGFVWLGFCQAPTGARGPPWYPRAWLRDPVHGAFRVLTI